MQRKNFLKMTSENFQIQRQLKNVVQPNDKLSGKVWTIPPDKFADRMQKFGRYRQNVVEDKKRNVQTKCKITIKNDAVLAAPNMFDAAVLTICISEMSAGNALTTVDRIYRGLTGNGHRRPTPGMEKAIVASVEKLMSTLIDVDLGEVKKNMNYPDMPEKIVSVILPADYEVRNVNGQSVTTIHFYKDSPLAIVARAKRQMLTYDARLLAVPGLRHTSFVVSLKFYLIERVVEIQRHAMTRSITFADVFEKCGLADATKWQKQVARRTIQAVMNHLKAEGVVDDFHFERSGNEYRTIKFCYSQLFKKDMAENDY